MGSVGDSVDDSEVYRRTGVSGGRDWDYRKWYERGVRRAGNWTRTLPDHILVRCDDHHRRRHPENEVGRSGREEAVTYPAPGKDDEDRRCRGQRGYTTSCRRRASGGNRPYYGACGRWVSTPPGWETVTYHGFPPVKTMCPDRHIGEVSTPGQTGPNVGDQSG